MEPSVCRERSRKWKSKYWVLGEAEETGQGDVLALGQREKGGREKEKGTEEKGL